MQSSSFQSQGECSNTSRPRVLHVYKDYFPPTLGGIEQTIHRLAHGCSDQFEVSVLVCSGNTDRCEEMDGPVRVVRVAERGRFSSAPIAPGFPSALEIMAGEADILHFHHPNPTADIAWLLKRPGKPIVTTYHSDVVRQKFSRVLYQPVQKRMLDAAAVIMPTSPQYLDSSRWLQPYRAKCRVVPLGIDLNAFAETEERTERARQIREQYGNVPLTIFVGRLRYYKGLTYLLQAMVHVPGKLIIVGTGPELATLQSEAESLKITKRVIFTGDLDHEEMVSHLYAADIFCMPSHLRSEAFGLSMVEAMACGLPVVSTSIPTGVPFVNPQAVSGLNVKPAQPLAIASDLIKLHGNESLRKYLGRGARERAHSVFSQEEMCERVKGIYCEVLSKQASA